MSVSQPARGTSISQPGKVMSGFQHILVVVCVSPSILVSFSAAVVVCSMIDCPFRAFLSYSVSRESISIPGSGCVGRAVTTISEVATDLPMIAVPSTTVTRAGQYMFFTNSLAVMVDYHQQERRIRQSLGLSLRPYQLTLAFQAFSSLT